jgi:hypothetical protein
MQGNIMRNTRKNIRPGVNPIRNIKKIKRELHGKVDSNSI